MKTIIRIIPGVIVILSIITFLFFPNVISFLGRKFYWFELLFVLFIVWGYNFSNTLILKIALTMTLIGGLLNVLVFNEFGEISLRIGLVFWVIGMARILISYRHK